MKGTPCRSRRRSRSRRRPTRSPTPTSPGPRRAPTLTAFTAIVPDREANWLGIGVVFGLILLGLGLPTIVRWWRRTHPSPTRVPDDDPVAACPRGRRGHRLPHRPVGLSRWSRPAISPRLPVAARPLKSLAEVATAATYATDEEVAQLATAEIAGEPGPRRWCRQVERIAADSMTTGGRIRRYFTVWA